jgi:hypothetical protein
MEIPVADLIQDLSDFENPDNHPTWYPLNPRNVKEQVSGDICLQFGLVGYMEPSFKQIAQSSYVPHYASLIATEDPADGIDLLIKICTLITHVTLEIQKNKKIWSLWKIYAK